MFFKLIKVHLLVSELYMYQNARCNNKKNYKKLCFYYNYFLIFMTKLADFYTLKLFPYVIEKVKIHCGVLLIFCKCHLILTNSAII